MSAKRNILIVVAAWATGLLGYGLAVTLTGPGRNFDDLLRIVATIALAAGLAVLVYGVVRSRQRPAD